MAVCIKFRLLLWKNWLFRKRQLISTIFSIIVTILLAGLLLYVMYKIGEDYSTYEPDFTSYEEIPIPLKSYFNKSEVEEALNTSITDLFGNKTVYYTPDNDISRDLLFYVMSSDSIPVNFKPLKDENSMAQLGIPDPETVLAGISFVGLGNSLPSKLHYRLRVVQEKQWNTDVLFAPKAVNQPVDTDYDKIFIILQNSIAIRFIEKSSGNGSTARDSNSSISDIMFATQKFPYPPHYEEKQIAQFLRFLLPLFIIVCFIFIFPPLVKSIVSEKETGIKELMKLMGFSTWLQWCAWFVSTFIMAIIILIILFLAWFIIKRVFPYTAPELFLLFMILYITSSISFCFFFSTFFSKPSIAIACCVIVMIMSFFIPSSAFAYTSLGFTVKIFLLLLPNMALNFIIRFMVDFEVKDVGLNWNNLVIPSTYGDKLTSLHVLLMFIFDTIFYWLLAWYLDNVLPSVFGIRKPWYFLFTANYWCPATDLHEDFDDESIENSDDFEDDPVGLTPLVEVIHLTKKFGRGKSLFVAVNNLTFNMYEGQITGLLGHNGAGKTTTMSMLTGMIPPTSGTAYINGYDIRTKMDSARKSLGLCPQHNMLFNNLTCQEHLKFFGGLKINSKEELNDEIDSLLTKLQLQEKRKTKVKNLSGGMKRKLNLGIALIGHPKVIMLDEPTSGLDPEARRAIWDVIQEHREESCIVLSTHFMDEADALSDRIAIMANGQLVCCGSPTFLKNRYGAGYHLHLVKSKTMRVNVNKITALVNKHIYEAHMSSNTKNEVSYVLPASQTKYFANFFKDLESNISSYGITGFGLSVSTVEDVFLKVGEESPGDTSFIGPDSNPTSTSTTSASTTFDEPFKSTGIILKLKQIFGLILKRWYYAKRRWIILIFQILIPALIIILGLKLGEISLNQSPNEPPLVMDISQYSTITFINEDEDITPWYKSSLPSYVEVLIQPEAEDFVKEVATQNYKMYVEELILGAMVTDSSAMTAWYNGLYYHTEPLSLNILHNALLKHHTNDQQYELVVENVPFPKDSLIPDYNNRIFQILMIAIYFPLGISFLTSSFVIFPIHERATMCKQLQMMTGVGGILFWSVSFLWDFAIHVICSCILILIILIFDDSNLFTQDGKLGLVFLLILLYGWSSIPFTYLISLTNKSPAVGFTRLILINVICGIVISMALFIISNIERDNPSSIIDFLVLIARFLSSFTITFALMKIAYIGSTKPLYCSPQSLEPTRCSDLEYYKWEYPGINGEILALILTGVLFFILLALYECNILEKIWYICCFYCKLPTFGDGSDEEDEELDSDVSKERDRVYKILAKDEEDEQVLLVHDLTKRFGRFTAVRGLNFALDGEDCFGLIGINGAGKTTTFQMLTANLTITKGNAFIYGTSVKDNRSEYLENVGYCPQFDPLIDYLTGREMLIVFAYLCGIQRTVIKEMLDDYIEDFDLQDHARKITRVYSGGNKRKLSLALAFIGDPPVVFLDEPTTGVDPVARRKIRDVLRSANQSGTCVVLTSHSMEECEALCNRVGLMVKGQFRCFGGIQYLKNKFSEGYVIFARLKRLDESPEKADKRQKDLQKYIETHIPSSELTDVHQGLVQYQVYDKKIKWADMFETMEKAKSRFNLEDYTVSQTSLDQVFLSFAREEQ